jgi:hypothetical protein
MGESLACSALERLLSNQRPLTSNSRTRPYKYNVHTAPQVPPRTEIRLATGRTENGWPLNDAQRPTSRAVRVAINMGYNRVRGIVGTSRETVA